jgi:hypothetical protein
MMPKPMLSPSALSRPALCALCAVALLSAPIPLRAAQSVALGAYLLSAKEDDVLKARRAEGELAYSTYSGLPLIRDLEFRLQNGGFDPEDIKYTLRIKPRGFGEGSASRQYNEAEVKRGRDRNRLLFNRALVDRYMLAIDCLMRRSIHALDEELLVVTEDRIKVLDSRKTTTDFDLAVLIESEDDLTKLHSQDLEIQKELAVLEQQIGLQLPAAGSDSVFPGFDTTGFVDVDVIIAEAERGGYALDTNHVYLDYLKQGLALAEHRYRLEKAEGSRYLNFLSFSYDVGKYNDQTDRRDEGKDYDLSKAYSVEAAFRLPFLTTGDQELNRRKEALLSEKEDYRQSRDQLEAVMRKDIKDIHALVSQYRYLKARETQVDARASLKKYMQMSGVDPLALLSIKAGELKNRIKMEEVRYGIVRNWIKVMDATGQLAREPLRNYLAAGRPEIRP